MNVLLSSSDILTLVEELVRHEPCYLLLDVPGLGDGPEITGSHEEAPDQGLVLPVRPVQPRLHQVEGVAPPLEVDGEVSGQDGLLYHKNYRLELVLRVEVRG